MDALSDLLRAVKLNGAIFLEARFTAPWCTESRSGHDGSLLFEGGDHVVFFHVITHGRCSARLQGGGEAVELQAGDLLLLPKDDTHLLGSDLQLAPVLGESLVKPPSPGGLYTIDYGGGGDETRVMCGFLSCDSQLSRPLLDALPRILHMPLGEEPAAAWLLQLLRQGALAVTGQGPGTETVVAKLSELMFVEAVRRYMASMPDTQTGWLAGLRDRHVGRALALLHGQPARDWGMEELAAEAGLSRSALAQRFTDLIGQPPMQYLTRWRLSLAAGQLRHSARSIAAIGGEAGYDSEAGFNRAFKRAFGVPPAAWRRLNRSAPG